MIWFISFIIILLPSYLFRLSIFNIPTTLLEILIYIAALWLLISQAPALTTERLKPILRRFGLPIALLLIGALIGTIVAPDKRQALGLSKAYLIDPILLFLIVVSNEQCMKKKEVLFLSFVASGLVTGLSAFWGGTAADGRAIGIYSLDPTASPNFLALFLSPIAVFSFFFLLTSPIRSHRWFTALSLVIMSIALFLTGSRGGLLATGFGLLLGILWKIKQRVPKSLATSLQIMSGIALLLFAIGSFWLAKPNFTASPSHREATSNNLRYEIWRTTVVDILPRTWLTGVGMGNYQAYFTKITQNRINFPEFISPWARTPHNIFLTIWTNFGLFGFIGFIWLLIIFFLDTKSRISQQPAWQVALAGAMITLLIHGFVDAHYYKNDLAAQFWLLVAFSQLAKQLT